MDKGRGQQASAPAVVRQVARSLQNGAQQPIPFFPVHAKWRLVTTSIDLPFRSQPVPARRRRR